MSGAVNPLEMSDEDFLKMNGPAETPVAGEQQEEQEEEVVSPEDASVDNESADDSGEADGGSDETVEEEADDEGDEGKEGAEVEAGANGLEETSDKDASDDEESAQSSDDTVDYKALYLKMMTPFKANGKLFTPTSIEEVIQLAQMGANYTKKLQDIQPHRKVLLMLQNNDLLDEGKLSYLIDLDKKDPKAIQKLVKDAGIDPMDIDTDADSDYEAGNHSVSDEEAQFRGVLEEVASSETGKETVQVIQSTWDQASKEVLWSQPDILKVMHEQRESGVYTKITSEIERQRILGKITPTTSFLEAYQVVGNQLYGQPNTSPQQSGSPTGSEQRRELERRPATPKPKVTAGDKAKAAGNTRSSPQSSKAIVNPLAMSDEEFLKMDSLKNRL